MRSLFPVYFFILLSISFTNCHSSQKLLSSQQLEESLLEQIDFHVKCLNDKNAKGLEKVYAENYEGFSPITKFESKEDLIDILVKNQSQQSIHIEFEIIEISVSTSMAYALLDWKVIEKANTPQEKLLYNKKHLQIWELNSNNWQLKRSLFYN